MENTTAVKTDRYIVTTSSAHMPNRGVEEIVHHYGPCHVGTTERCEYQRILRVAEADAARLNAAEQCNC